jgi:hypothetical protein
MAGSDNPRPPVVIRSTVPSKSNYGDYRPYLRLDFWFACAYCSIAEAEATGVSFDIDHYEPQQTHPALKGVYDNLMYSCRLCNRIKADEEPNDEMRAKGIRFFRPDLDDPDTHFEVYDITEIRHKTPIGDYTIEAIRLHRQQLKNLRRSRHRLYKSREITHRGLQALRQLKIDYFPPKLRIEVFKAKAEAEAQAEKALENLDAALREMNRSANLDLEPDTKASTRRRREYLNKIHAAVPEVD